MEPIQRLRGGIPRLSPQILAPHGGPRILPGGEPHPASSHSCATRKVLMTSWIVVIMVVLLVMLIRVLDQPWRGIIDAGVVVGLFGGLLSLLWIFLARLGGRPLDFDPAIPDTIPSPESE